MKKSAELKTKTPEQLQDLLIELRKEAFNLRFQTSNGSLKNTARIRLVRRDIARVKTFMNYKNNS